MTPQNRSYEPVSFTPDNDTAIKILDLAHEQVEDEINIIAEAVSLYESIYHILKAGGKVILQPANIVITQDDLKTNNRYGAPTNKIELTDPPNSGDNLAFALAHHDIIRQQGD